MILLEHEAKSQLLPYGLPFPPGQLWPLSSSPHFPVVVKAQLEEGGRGLRGGVIVANDQAELIAAIDLLTAGTSRLAPAGVLLVETFVEVARELFVAFTLDRDAGLPILLVSAAGGVHVEEHASNVLRLGLNLGEPLDTDLTTLAGRWLKVDERQGSRLAGMLESTWSAFQDLDADLIEINPLAVTKDGDLSALDVKMTVDDNARFRHPEWPIARTSSAFERICQEHGAVGAELTGSIGVVTSGAGLGMATLDLVQAMGGTARCLIDLGGSVFGEPDAIASALAAMDLLEPASVVVNFNLQIGRCDLIANAIALCRGRGHLSMPVFVRAQGNQEEAATAILHRLGVEVFRDMTAACQAAVNAVGGI